MSTRPQFGRYKVLYRKQTVNSGFSTEILYKEDFPHYCIQVDAVNRSVGFTASAQLKGSVDNVLFYDIGSPVSISSGGTILTGTNGIPFLRVDVNILSGNADFNIVAHAIA